MTLSINKRKYISGAQVDTSALGTLAIKDSGLKGVLDGCDLDVKVEAVDCIKSTSGLRSFLKVGASGESRTLNYAATADFSELLDGSPLVLADRDLSDNLNYFDNLLTLAKVSSNAEYNILKVSYKSPCELAALSFKVDVPDSAIVCPIGIYSTKTGSITTAAYNKMVSITPMSYDGSPIPTSQPNLCFVQKEAGTACPATASWSTFCYLIVVSVEETAERTPCLDGNFSTSHIKGFKNEFVHSSLDLIGTPLYNTITGGSGANLNSGQWAQLLLGQIGLTLMWLLSSNNLTTSLASYALANCDYDKDDDINAGDLLSIFKLYYAVAKSSSRLEITNLPNIVPKNCCDDIDTSIPTKPKQLACAADIEILNVVCHDGTSYHGKAGSGDLGGTVGGTRGTELSKPSDCDDIDGGLQNDSGTGSMEIDIAIRNSTTVSGFQFDIGFNKFSSASPSMFSILMNSELKSSGWEVAHKVCDDRFGYDKSIRVISYQALGSPAYSKGYNIFDNEFYAQAQQLDSLQPSSEPIHVIKIRVMDAPKTTCECPTKTFYIAEGLDSVKTENRDQITNPSLYEVGNKWTGPAVQSGGHWWTANAMGGEPIRDASSVRLVVEWEGLKILNKRVVTNQELQEPRHASYGSIYYGHYSGLLASIPKNYESYESTAQDAGYIAFYRSEFAGFVDKALHNGLDVGYNREKSKYDYLWQFSYKAIIKWLEVYQAAIGGPAPSDDQKQQILDGFLVKDYKGYHDDANLDGKFDVADIVALYNSARMRFYGLPGKNKDALTSDWRSPPTTNWDWCFVTWDNNYTEADKQMQHGNSYTFDEFPNFHKIVPTYCQDSICTSTKSDLCPDICGNIDYETKETLGENAKAFSLIGFGDRVDIHPNLGAKLELVFSALPADNSYFILNDAKKNRTSFKFVANGSATTGDSMVGRFTAIEKQATLALTLAALKTYMDSSSSSLLIGSTVSTTFATNDTITFTQDVDGEMGNMDVEYSDSMKASMLRYQNRFVDGANFYSSKPHTFRSWSEYFFDLHNIKTSDLYKNEVQHGVNGASFVPLELRVTSDNKNLTEALSYVSWSWSTLDFCKAYTSTDSLAISPMVKVLPGDGFTMCEVFDAETGARLTAITAETYNNFYVLPGHKKISILSHNFKTVGGVENLYSKPSLENCDRFAPITMDGGKLVTAKLFMTPMPLWSKGRYVEILSGHNSALSEHNGAFSSHYAPLGVSIDIANTSSKSLAVGPKTSEYSDNYAEDSASLITYSDYMLHAQILNPRTMLIKYNTMKPFKYASFSIRARNGSSEIEKVSYPANSIYEGYKGWEFAHHFHQNKSNAAGLPLSPTRYSSDGYSVVTVSATGSFTDIASVPHTGTANPKSFSGMGDLCIIKFKENICSELPIMQKKYICPPIGADNLKYPDKKVDTTADEKAKKVDNKYPEGTYGDKKYKGQDSTTLSRFLVTNYDSANNEDGKMTLATSAATSIKTLEKWYSTPFGSPAGPHNSNSSHKPTYELGTGDARFSLFFNQIHGLTTTGSANHQVALTKWSAYCTVKPEDLTLPRMTLFRAGGNGSTSANISLVMVKNSSNYTIEAIIQGNNSSNSATTTTLATVATTTAFDGWYIFSWVGDFESSSSSLYMNGALVASTTALTQSSTLAAANLAVTIGHDGTNNTINNSNSNSFDGRFGQFTLFNEAHDTDNRQKVEAYLAIKYELQGNLPFEHIGYKHTTIGNGLTDSGYLALNKVDNLTATAKSLQTSKIKGENSLYLGDYDSDRCAAAWVSKNICLDKDSQTLVSAKCGNNTGTTTTSAGSTSYGGGG